MAAPTDWEGARQRLRDIRDSGERCSYEVTQLWDRFLEPVVEKLGSESEVWLIYEQVFIAALDCGSTALAKECLGTMSSQFPKSLRVRRLAGMLLEALGEYKEAAEVYEELLKVDETDPHVHKRRIVLLKSQDQIPDAIQALNKYLEAFCVDAEAWMELCDLYLSQLDYEKAAFCMEELVMSNPHNHLFHQKFAEIKYSQGDFDTARAYFSATLKLNPNNMRALFGSLLAASKVASMKSSAAKVKSENLLYAAWAAEQIASKYKERPTKCPGSEIKEIEAALHQLQVTSQ